MKRLMTLVILMITFTISVVAEIVKFKTVEVYTRELEDGKWTEYSLPSPYEMPITIDLDNDLITCYSKNDTITYLLTECMAAEPYENGDFCFMFRFRDLNTNETGIIRLIKRKTNGRREIYIRYPYSEEVYTLKLLK